MVHRLSFGPIQRTESNYDDVKSMIAREVELQKGSLIVIAGGVNQP